MIRLWVSALGLVAAFTGLVVFLLFREDDVVRWGALVTVLWLLGWVAGLAEFALMNERRSARRAMGVDFQWKVGLHRKANQELHVHLLTRRPQGEGVEVVDLTMLPWTANEIGERLRETAVEADMSNKNR